MRVSVAVVIAAFGAMATTAAASVPRAVRISGGAPAQQRVVRAVLAKLGSQRITAVTFKPHAHMLGITNGQEMDVSGVDRSLRTHWDEQLFAVAYLRESLTTRAPEPRLIVLNGDTFVPVHGPRHPGRIPPAGPRASAKVVARYVAAVKLVAKSESAHVVGVDVMRPGPVGVAVTLRVPDPASFLKHRLNGILTTSDNLPLGILTNYLGVVGPTGTLVFAIAEFPTGNSIYIAPKLRGCPQLGISGLGMTSVPPCPAK